MQVGLEDDPTPLVRIIATTLSQSIANPDLARKAANLNGVFALRSAKDPQAVTMRFSSGRVDVARGVADDAQVVATVDLDNMSGPDAAKPKVTGALRHPKFALGVSKLLDGDKQPWTAHADAFFAFAAAEPGMPAHTRVVCLDGGETRDFGDATAPVEYEIHGSADALTAVFSGGAVFGQDLLDGKVFASGTLQHASIITGQSIAWMMRGSA
ncbi:MAG TPA: hypothetical protein VL856_16825 [Acidimicrobiia bacterium]|jgi:hypothetical protein|nr:hypothetical protein [Acidimicrobiia bacterium]